MNDRNEPEKAVANSSNAGAIPTAAGKVAISRADAARGDAIAALLDQVGLPASHLEDLSLFLVAEHNGLVVGCVGLERYGRSAVARSLAVRSDYQRQGVGERLLAEAIQLARAQKLEALFGLVHKPAERLVRRHGFEEVSREQAPGEILRSWQFQSCGCASAPCFRLRLV